MFVNAKIIILFQKIAFLWKKSTSQRVNESTSQRGDRATRRFFKKSKFEILRIRKIEISIIAPTCRLVGLLTC